MEPSRTVRRALVALSLAAAALATLAQGGPPTTKTPKATTAARAAEADAAAKARARAAELEAEAAAKAKAEAADRAAEAVKRDAVRAKLEAARARVGTRAHVRMGPVIRADIAAPAAVKPRAAVGREIFVPAPKGAGETLDDSADKGAKGKGDSVTTIRGDRVVGRVVSITEDGHLHLTAPHFVGEVVVLANAIDRIDLTPSRKAASGDFLSLTNGDRIVGEVAGITADHVIIESQATGPIKISRKILQSIAFAQTSATLLESAFKQGRMDPWKPRGGGWTVVNGALQCSSHGSRQTVFAKFEQREAVTMEAKVEATMGRYINCELVLFSDTSDGSYGRNSVVARFYSSQFYLMYTRNGGTNSIMNRSMGRTLRNATVRLAYDPAKSKARVWIDKNDLGEYNVPHKLTKGSYVMFNTRYPCRVHHINVSRGIASPTGETKTTDAATHIIRFANRDRVAANEVKLDDGKVSFETSFGTISAKVDKVQSIVFRSKGLEKPRRLKGDVWVETATSRYTLQFKNLSPEHLIGRSAYLGEVKIRRDCLRRIRFNIYK